MGKLDGKVAVITGGTSGMALATAKLFVEEGAYVFITGRRKDLLDAAVKEIGRDVSGVLADSSNLADLDRLFETVKAKKGHLDVLFASAGGGELDKQLGGITPESFDKTFNLNARGTFFTVQKALPLLRDGSSVILNGSIAAVKGFPGTAVYGGAKAALHAFARVWTQELKARKIRVNVLHPGSIGDTEMFANAALEMKDMLVSMIPAGRLGVSPEIATAALFLASSDSSFVTGSALCVDGGMAQV